MDGTSGLSGSTCTIAPIMIRFAFGLIIQSDSCTNCSDAAQNVGRLTTISAKPRWNTSAPSHIADRYQTTEVEEL